MRLLYTVLASDPATPPALLRRLYRLAHDQLEQHPMRSAWRHHPAAPLLAALATNPATPTDLLEELIACRLVPIRRALLARPGLSAQQAIDLLGTDTRAAVLRQALSVVDDPSGALATHVMGRSNLQWVLSDIIGSGHTSEQARLTAARRLAQHPVKKTVAARITALARRHPDVAAELAESTTSDALRDQLVTLLTERAAQRVREPAPGRVSRKALAAWLAQPERTLEQVRDYVTAEPRALLVRTAITDFADLTGAVADAALDAHPDRVVASAIQAASGLPVAVRRRAGLLVAATGTGISHELAGPLQTLVRADAAFASDVALVCGDRATINVCMTHAGLRPDAVTALAAYFDSSRHAYNSDWLWLATHPYATREQRELGLSRVLESAESSRLNDGPDTDWQVYWAQAGVRAAQDGPAAAVAQLPCSAVSGVQHWGAQPGLVRLLADGLSAHLEGADHDAAAHVLIALADGFHGTIADLVSTAAAVAT